ncbi:uncharacterized protein LOC116778757 [Danaus plexippus]|uniref:Uncharacterized protein n=1 Tax=Danaus plexippus plexippus TaxID=278856 RepID=A0A212FI20_DANPL|nr:uncharacterized protein LOC116778757 [Danaus plexippus]OWR53383.1 hypothetical protein KGM_205544 [Danaus plexippus plexippus]
MALKSFLLVLMLSFLVTASAFSTKDVESRGKKKKIALFIYFADLVLKKIFIFKIIYAFIFWLVIHKAGYFLSWFVSYLKDQKLHHHDHHDHHDHYLPHYDSHYGPYRKQSHGIL